MAETIEPRRGIFNITTYDKDRYSQSFFSFLFFFKYNTISIYIYIYKLHTSCLFLEGPVGAMYSREREAYAGVLSHG